MGIGSRISIGLATVLLALATTGDAKAQVYGGFGYGYGYGTPYYNVGPRYGYGVGYGYNGYPYYAAPVYIPQTYNNLGGIAGMVGQSVAPRRTYVVPTYRGFPR
jgi:hypothetical protein